MQTLTKTEIAWIYDALRHMSTHYNLTMQASEPNSTTYSLAELRRDGLQGVMHKLATALNDHNKRIKID